MTEPLHELIHSLSAGEKGYFKKHAPAGESNYLALFDLINRMDEPDEEKLAKEFRKKKLGKNLAMARQYLYEGILRSLRSYHKARYFEAQTEEMIFNAKLLFEKGRYDDCARQLKKTKEQAWKYEHLPQLLSLLEFEDRFNQFRLADNRETLEEEKRVLEILGTNNRLSIAYNALLQFLFRHDKAKTEAERAEAAALLNDPALQRDPQTLSFRGKNLFYGIHFFYRYVCGDDVRATQEKTKQLENYLQHPHMIEANARLFLLVLGNVLSMLYYLEDREAFNKYYAQMLESHAALSGHEHIRLEQSLSFGVLYYKINCLTSEGIRFIEAHEETINANAPRFGLIKLLDIYFNACIFYFRAGDYKRAIHWLNKVLNNEKVEERQHIHCYSRILQLVIHYELGNAELLESLAKSTHRYLYRRNKIYAFDHLFLQYIKHIARDYYDEEKKKLHFTNLRGELLRLQGDAMQKHSIAHFDYVGWLEKKAGQKL